MSNYVALNLFVGEQASVATSVAIPTAGSGGIYFEQLATPIIMGGTTILSRIILSSGGLNRASKVYFSALDVPSLVTAAGATLYKTFSVYRSVNSTVATNVAFPVTGEIGLIVETAPVAPNAIVIAGVSILSQFVVNHQGLNIGRRFYYSGQTVAQIVTTMG